jgi:hypothetical protein
MSTHSPVQTASVSASQSIETPIATPDTGSATDAGAGGAHDLEPEPQSSVGGAGGGGNTDGATNAGGGSGGDDAGGAGNVPNEDCAEPINPNATKQARNLLCYLYSIAGTAVLSGQQETSWDSPESDMEWYNERFGVYPAILGGDYLYPTGTTDRAIAYGQAGGIVMIRYHMGAPPTADTYESSKGTANIGNVLTPGTNENASYLSKLDYVASELQRLQDANIPVLWAPLHEFQPNGWFWWSKGTDQQFIELWTTMYEYLTETKGLNNLVWLAPSSGSPTAQWFPDKSLWDLAGPDTYATNPPFSAMYDATKQIVGGDVPIPLHETGVVPQPSTMFPSSAPWVLWNIWSGYQISENSEENIRTAYESPYTITRDEVPDLN